MCNAILLYLPKALVAKNKLFFIVSIKLLHPLRALSKI